MKWLSTNFPVDARPSSAIGPPDPSTCNVGPFETSQRALLPLAPPVAVMLSKRSAKIELRYLIDQVFYIAGKAYNFQKLYLC